MIERKSKYAGLLGGLLLMLLGPGLLKGQNKQQDSLKKVVEQANAKLDELKKAEKKAAEKKTPYQALVPKEALVRSGLFTISRVLPEKKKFEASEKSELSPFKWYLEIPDSLLGRDILISNRIAKGAINNKPEDRAKDRSGLGYAGDPIYEEVISFERRDSTILMRKKSYLINGLKPGDPMYENVMRSATQPIAKTMKVLCENPKGDHVVELTALLNSDDPLIGFDASTKQGMHIGALISESSWVQSVIPYPQNLSIRTVRTYKGGEGKQNTALSSLGLGGEAVSKETFTYELNSSWVLLPKQAMRGRELDNRVGYFSTAYYDFTSNEQQVNTISLINRWRLEPKPEDRQKYLSGQLVEPAKPIVIYIDPTTPEKWVPYLIKGINDWQKAFEKAGFKNAILGKRAPGKAQDSTWSIDDVRYSVLLYMPSAIANASGPHTSDPRSGEILGTHINWYHNVMNLLNNWYMIQAAAIDPRARKAKKDVELMGELIRFVSSHEVGHTLGLPHNHLASNATPVEKLRDKAWVEKNGHTPSIMDYARFNYVAQPEDHIGESGIFPRIGDYDNWAIEWGYKWFGEVTKAQEKEKLKAMVLISSKNPRLAFSSGTEVGLMDPRSTSEMIGDNAMKANSYGMKNLAYIADHLTEWLVKKDGSDYEDLQNGYSNVVNQYANYLRHVFVYFYGGYSDEKLGDQPGVKHSAVPIALQREALDFVNRYLLQEPKFLYNKDVLDRITQPQSDISDVILNYAINNLFEGKKLGYMTNMANRYGTNTLQPLEYFKYLQDKIFQEIKSGEVITNYRRSLQGKYVKKLIGLIDDGGMDLSAITGGGGNKEYISGIGKAQLQLLYDETGTYLDSGKSKDELTQIHLKGIRSSIKKALDLKS